MGTKQINQTMRMTTGGIHLLSSGQSRPSERARRTQASVETPVQRPSSHVLKVMVVVTGQEQAESLELAMRRFGYEVGAAHDGPTALEMARATQPDVAIVEVESPRFCRCRLAGRIRNELARADGLIIAVTKQADRECRRQCRDAGIDVVLAMPVNPEVLETLLWMEGTRLDRMLPHTDRGSGLRPKWQGVSAGVESYLVTPAEVSVEQIELLERVRVAAGQTS